MQRINERHHQCLLCKHYIFARLMVYRGGAKDFIKLKPTKQNGELRHIWPSYFTFRIANNKGADQTARMRRLVCAFVVCKQQSQGVLHRGPCDVQAHVSWPPPGYTPGVSSHRSVSTDTEHVE